MTRAPQSGSGMWSCYIKQDPETQLFISHCLDLHFKVSAKTPEKAWDRLKRCIKAYYEYSYSCDPEALKLTATAAEWTEFKDVLKATLRDHPEKIKVETIELVLRPPKLPEQMLPLSFQRVECGQQAVAV
jgi:hypothetical protein